MVKKLISPEQLKSTRLGRSEVFDVQPYCGFPLKIRIGEVPSDKQPDLVQLVDESNAIRVAGTATPEQHRKLAASLKAVYASALMHEDGAPLSGEDIDDLHSVIPAGVAGVEFTQAVTSKMLARAASKVNGPLVVSTPEPETSSSDSVSLSASHTPTT